MVHAMDLGTGTEKQFQVPTHAGTGTEKPLQFQFQPFQPVRYTMRSDYVTQINTRPLVLTQIDRSW